MWFESKYVKLGQATGAQMFYMRKPMRVNAGNLCKCYTEEWFNYLSPSACSLASRLLWNTSLQTLVQHCEQAISKDNLVQFDLLQPLSPADTAWNAWRSRVAQVPPFTQVLRVYDYIDALL